MMENGDLLTRRGNVVAPTIYEDVGSFSEGLACVKKDGKIGYIDKSGEVVIPFEYEDGGLDLYYLEF